MDTGPASTSDSTVPLATTTQRRWLVGRVDFALFADRLQFEEHRLLSRERRFLYFGGVKERADVLGGRPWLWLAAAALLGLITLLAAPAMVEDYRRSGTGAVLGFMLFVCATGAVFCCFLKTVGRRRYVLAYRTYAPASGQARPVPWLYLDARRRNREEVARFLELVRRAHVDWQERAKALQAAVSGLSEAEMFGKFASLHGEGILDDDEFALVKSKIVGADGQRIGFRPTPGR